MNYQYVSLELMNIHICMEKTNVPLSTAEFRSSLTHANSSLSLGEGRGNRVGPTERATIVIYVAADVVETETYVGNYMGEVNNERGRCC